MPASPIASFDACACGRHGRISYPGAEHRPAFWLECASKEFAKMSVDAAIQWKLISPALRDTLCTQIEFSDLPETDADANDMVKAVIGQWNFDLRTIDGRDPAKFHDCFDFGPHP